MEIILKINGEDKTFKAPFVSARKLKKTFALSKKFQEGFDEKNLDEIADYLTDIYNKQFTCDELLDGFPSNEFFNKALEDMGEVIGEFNSKVKN